MMELTHPVSDNLASRPRDGSHRLAADLDHVLAQTTGLWEELRGQRIFITGGTGFFGCWLLESFVHANEKLGLDASATVLTRNPDAFQKKAPGVARHASIRLHTGRVTDFEFPSGSFSHIIHAATEALHEPAPHDYRRLFDADVAGTRRVLDFAVACRARKFLFTSSGAVYGPQPADMTHIPEDYQGAPSPVDVNAAYGHSKRISEFLCATYAQQHGFDATIARCFAFAGPHLPLDANYAIGNFIRDALRGGPIHIHGDGTPHRSYLYAADLAAWLWTILIRGDSCRVYNVGSDAALTVTELAEFVANVLAPRSEILKAKRPDPGASPARYVPSTRRARTELGLEVRVGVPESIRRMAEWHRDAV